MCITSETCRADSVIKTAQNNLHQAGPNKTHICLFAAERSTDRTEKKYTSILSPFWILKKVWRSRILT